MKKEIIMGIAAFSMLIASCGGGDTTEGNGSDTAAKDTIPTIVFTDYVVDTAATIITWKAYGKIGDTSDYHLGTIKTFSGNIQASDSAGTWELSAGDLTIDMNTIKESGGAIDLDTHLRRPDFFDVYKYSTSAFTFESFADGMITGTLLVLEEYVTITAPAEVIITPETVTVNVAAFKIDFSALGMPFYEADAKQKPEKQHDPKIEIWATIVANKM